MRRTITALTLSLLVFLACSSRQQPAAQAPVATPNQEQKMEIKLTSTAFKEGEAIPRQYTCDGIDISPPLEWTGVPKSAKTIALIADDPDAPSGRFVLCVLYRLPAGNIGLVYNVAGIANVMGRWIQ